ncbi:hypothetical protein [Kitasatospora aureofaciens]|uniref:hypothetical protein n=1 Tax=Kitasatospora aureofaciens TaxID=1894 RepID=UPI00123CACD2
MSGVEGSYKLLRQTSRWARFARVTVSGETSAEPAVQVGADVFGWRVRSYGPTVGAVQVGDEQFRAEALDGVRYALARLPEESRGLSVSVVEIVTSPVDTGPGDVKFAAAHAVWAMVGRQPGRQPWIDADGVPVFP